MLPLHNVCYVDNKFAINAFFLKFTSGRKAFAATVQRQIGQLMGIACPMRLIAFLIGLFHISAHSQQGMEFCSYLQSQVLNMTELYNGGIVLSVNWELHCFRGRATLS